MGCSDQSFQQQSLNCLNSFQNSNYMVFLNYFLIFLIFKNQLPPINGYSSIHIRNPSNAYNSLRQHQTAEYGTILRNHQNGYTISPQLQKKANNSDWNNSMYPKNVNNSLKNLMQHYSDQNYNPKIVG